MNVAMSIFRYQYKNNEIYCQYVDNLIEKENVSQLEAPIFLPIEAFKNEIIKSGDWDEQQIFTSSGTTNAIFSKHYVKNLTDYLNATVKCWEEFYSKVEDYCYLCLLPGYMEREGSSLIAMMKHFVEKSKYKSGFYLNNHEDLLRQLQYCKENCIPTVLFGVSFGLMDFIAKYQMSYPELIIMETGGMKGRREELIKEELHELIQKAFGVKTIHSEYGMTELFSQAYSKGKGVFYQSKSLKIVVSEITDPLTLERNGKTGIVNIIDLNNVDTCSFIQTSDLGILHDDGSFKLMGRLDHSDIRGCNLMIE